MSSSSGALIWTRVGPKSGPGNILNGRWRVERYGDSGWVVRDLTKGDHGDEGIVGGRQVPYPTMRLGRRAAVAIAAKAAA